MDSFLTPAAEQQFELEIKRSQFITRVAPVQHKDEAKAYIQTIRERYPDANHHCWAMVAGQPDDVYGQDQSDDGEPKGTAGKPMLNVLQHSDLGHVVVVVTRYFGGIKLGAGGLVRAYTQCVSSALKTLETTPCYLRETVQLDVPYAVVATLEHWLKSTNISQIEANYTDRVQFTLLVPKHDLAELEIELIKLCGGQEHFTLNASP